MIDIDAEIAKYGNSLKMRLGLPLADYDSEQSKFFKFCQPAYKNIGVQERE